MAKSNPEVICLKGEPIYKEDVTSSVVKPGYLVEFDGLGGVRAQSAEKQGARRAFALENAEFGKGINDIYEVNDRVRYGLFHNGMEVYAKLPAGTFAVKKGSWLEASGDGTVRLLGKNAGRIGFALEDKDNSSGTTEVFIRMEVS